MAVEVTAYNVIITVRKNDEGAWEYAVRAGGTAQDLTGKSKFQRQPDPVAADVVWDPAITTQQLVDGSLDVLNKEIDPPAV